MASTPPQGAAAVLMMAWERPGRAPNWTLNEEIVLVYFNSRGANYQSCSTLINVKCGSYRKPTSADYRMRRIKQVEVRKHPDDPGKLYDKCAGWDLEAVNEWVTCKAHSVQHALDLIDLGSRERDIISQVLHSITSALTQHD